VGGHSDHRISTTLLKYNELIQKDSEAAQLYEGLTSEIIALRTAIDSGIHKIVSDLGVAATPSAVESARSSLENYLRVVVERSVVHCEYRDEAEVAVQDLLVTLSVMGRPLYWEEQALGATISLVQGEVQAEDEQDDEFVPMDEGMEDEEEELSDDDDDMETWDGKEEADEDIACFDRASFHRMVDVLNRWKGIQIAPEVYIALQSSAEDFLSQLFITAAKAVEYAGRKEVEANDVHFAQGLVRV